MKENYVTLLCDHFHNILCTFLFIQHHSTCLIYIMSRGLIHKNKIIFGLHCVFCRSSCVLCCACMYVVCIKLNFFLFAFVPLHDWNEYMNQNNIIKWKKVQVKGPAIKVYEIFEYERISILIVHVNITVACYLYLNINQKLFKLLFNFNWHFWTEVV